MDVRRRSPFPISKSHRRTTFLTPKCCPNYSVNHIQFTIEKKRNIIQRFGFQIELLNLSKKGKNLINQRTFFWRICDSHILILDILVLNTSLFSVSELRAQTTIPCVGIFKFRRRQGRPGEPGGAMECYFVDFH